MPKAAKSSAPATSAHVDAIAAEIIAIADEVWKHAELAFKEAKSVKLMKDAIRKHGFRITKDKVGDLATAFVAEYGKGNPVVGILAEYDALHWYPIERSAVANVRTTTNTRLTIEFEGTSAHAGVSPWLGRSALHAVELFAHGVNAMRDHLPTAR